MDKLEQLQQLLDTRFGGVIERCDHDLKTKRCCGLELLSAYRHIIWTDSPELVRSFDFRRLNDMAIPDRTRTKHLLPVLAAYDGCLDWDKSTQLQCVQQVWIETMRQIIPDIEGLSDQQRQSCLQCQTFEAIPPLLAEVCRERFNLLPTHWDDPVLLALAVVELVRLSSARIVESSERNEYVDTFIKACQIWLAAATH